MQLTDILSILVPLGIVIYWFITFLKNLTNKNWSGALTQAIAFVAAYGAIALYAQTTHIDLGEGSNVISQFNTAEQILVALFVAATGGTGSDILRTFNRSDANVAPTLIPSAATTPTVEVSTAGTH